MDTMRAKELLSRLADGIDPLTGELLPGDSVCNQAEIVRALHTALNALSSVVKKGKPYFASK